MCVSVCVSLSQCGCLFLTQCVCIRIYYSPEVIDWLCNDRQGPIPDGAAVVKEMNSIDSALAPFISLDDEGCMVVDQGIEPNGWAMMIKQSGESFDGWYYSLNIGEAVPNFIWTEGNPPVFDLTGVTTLTFFEDGLLPTEPNPDWYPTGLDPSKPDKIPDTVFPYNAYGAPACISCHASAVNEYIFSSLSNVLGKSIRYKQFESNQPGIEIPEEILTDSLLHIPIFTSFLNQSTLSELEEVANAEFTNPLPEPSLEFLEFYDQLRMVDFSQVWDLRLPAITYDHVFPLEGGPEQFVTSDQCWTCHDANDLLASQANMVLEVVNPDSKEILNLSPYGEWSTSPMGLAGRDPIFYSQLQSETNNLPQFTNCIENTCLHCHGVMGQRQLAIDTEGEDEGECDEFFGIAPPPEVPSGKLFRLDMVTRWPDSQDNEFQKYGALARDGISCTVCHHISETDLGDEKTFTGNFVTGPADEIYGPYEQVSVKPMQQGLGMTPQFGSQISNPDLCSSCHNILLPVITNEGEITGYSYEQTTYLEWQNSDFSQPGPGFTSCQDCHMKKDFGGEALSFEIANFESSDFPATTNRLPDEEIILTERDSFSRHSLHGLNIFFNQMSQQFPVILGMRQVDPFVSGSVTAAQITTQNSMVNMALNETANVEITELIIDQDGQLHAVVEVTNLAGHYIPSGVGFRRMFLEFLVRDAEGNILWASGRTNDLGAILEGTTNIVLPSEEPVKFPSVPFQPHYEVITEEDQVQIYQELVEDSAGALTTSFLRRVTEVKDNRIRPKGYNPEFFALNPSPFIQALAVIPGQAASDPYYTDPELTGADVIQYLISLDEETLSQVHHVKVTLYNQSIPPSYLQQRFRDANRGPAKKAEIERLYYLTSHLNVDDAEDKEGRQVIKDWKFFISSQTKRIEDQ